MRRPALALALLAGLAACGPVTVEQAERQCLEQARGATGPHGEVTLGVASDGRRVRPVSGIELSITSDALAGRDPSAVFDQCVLSRAGRMPTRPLAQQPGWRG